ncbi:MAG: hypothetical protein D4R95_00835 [Actinobacteria bacterium]|nr:MAG: hypothetical protein D4R95_00835 [Actinomycetota bacterium]
MNKQLSSVIVGSAIVAAMGVIGLGVIGNANAQSTKSAATNASSMSLSSGMSEGTHDRLPGMGGGMGGHGPRKDVAGIAAILNLSESDLKSQVQSGKTLAQIATAQGVDVKLVIDAIVASMKSHLADAVTSGKLTQAEADTKLADVTTKVTEMVNTGHPAGGEAMHGRLPGMGGGMNHGPGALADNTNA